MPYLPTSQAFLEQSAQLLEAYPDTVRQFHTYIHVQSDKLQYNPSRTTHPSKPPPPTAYTNINPLPPLPLQQQQPKSSRKNQLTPPADPDNNKIPLPNRNPRRPRQTRQITSQKSLHHLRNHLSTRHNTNHLCPRRLSHPQNLQSHHRHRLAVPDEQDRRGKPVDHGAGQVG